MSGYDDKKVSAKISLICILLLSLLLCATNGIAAETDSLQQLKSMSLENLMQLTVFSASKKTENLSDVAAAMYVITREDIRRSGARTLPDLLRGVPGLTVANMDAHTWAISSRGFNGRFANKLLVLMDGRTLYTPLYSGVYWDMQDTLLEDIERIEIIRGPGATIWGANAVNGVINIITRKAEDTDGFFASSGGGSLDKTLNARFGRAGEKLSYRIYAKYLDRDKFERHENDEEHPDDWKNENAGFRSDWEINKENQVSFFGDIYHGKSDQLTTTGSGHNDQSDVRYSGGNFQVQWQKDLLEDSALNVQAYVDRYLRESGFLNQSRTTYDLSFSHHFTLCKDQKVIWGGGYRYTTDHTSGSPTHTWNPASSGDEIWNLFVQDDLRLFDDRLHLIFGSKFEHNDYTGFEIQPSVRVVWAPDVRNSFWGAISRAVRTPSRTDSALTSKNLLMQATTTTVNTPMGPVSVPVVMSMSIYGNPDFESEEVIAYETGYRTQFDDDLSLDVVFFYNDYKNLRTQEPGAPVIDTHVLPVTVILPVTMGNNMSGETFGAELATNWQVTSYWKLSGSYSWIKLQLHHHGQNGDYIGEKEEHMVPEHQASLRSYVDFPHGLEWDVGLYYFSKYFFSSLNTVPAHLRCDMRIGWHPAENWELSVKVENLFDDQHREYFDNLGLITSDIPRNWYAEIKYHF